MSRSRSVSLAWLDILNQALIVARAGGDANFAEAIVGVTEAKCGLARTEAMDRPSCLPAQHGPSTHAMRNGLVEELIVEGEAKVMQNQTSSS